MEKKTKEKKFFPFGVGSLPADDVIRRNRFWCFIMKQLILVINLTLFLIVF